MRPAPQRLLRELEARRETFGAEVASEKTALIEELRRARLGSARSVLRLHDVLTFVMAHADDGAVRDAAQAALDAFGARKDLRRFARELEDSGLAGTALHYRFYWSTAQWLARKAGERLTIDWSEFEQRDRLENWLHLFVLPGESLAIDEAVRTPRRWLEILKGEDETDAGFLIRRFASMPVDEVVRETLYEDLSIPLKLAPGPSSPTRTGRRFAGAPMSHRTRPLDTSRPDLRRELARKPRRVTEISGRDADALIRLAQEAMVCRNRDLYVFQYASPEDVRLVDCGGGLSFAMFGLPPERRLMLDTVYGFLTLMNGVPMGYVLSSSFFNSAEVAYNVFETFRGGESGLVYGRILGVIHHLLGADAFTVPPYQLGHGNAEGLRSGAWWFYYKLGFRPRDAQIRRLVRAEREAMKQDPRHRSSLATLRRLVRKNMFWFSAGVRPDVRGLIDQGNVGLHASRLLATRFGADREKALRTCADEVRRRLGAPALRSLDRGERVAWDRWSPLVLALPGVERWSKRDKQRLVSVMRAKGGRRESDHARLFDAHLPLRRAVFELAKAPPAP